MPIITVKCELVLTTSDFLRFCVISEKRFLAVGVRRVVISAFHKC